MAKKPYKNQKKLYKHMIGVRLPDEVYEAVMKRVANKRQKYPSYSDAEVMRKALVRHLKEKGYLDKDKSYL
jgi:Arc/MetJ-type ribon-helix-helix transcriptional regulator